jgi:hypothetical protein
MRSLRCRIGIHRFRGWVTHTNGPCVFESEAHVFRRCERCPKMEHEFATINNGEHDAPSPV